MNSSIFAGISTNTSVYVDQIELLLPNLLTDDNLELFQVIAWFFMLMILLSNGYIITFIYKQLSKVGQSDYMT